MDLSPGARLVRVLNVIAGLGGEHSAVPMARLMIGGAALSMVGLLVLARGGSAEV